MNGATADLVCEENCYPEPLATIGFRPERALFHGKLAGLFVQLDGFPACSHWFCNGTAKYAVGHQTKAGIRSG